MSSTTLNAEFKSSYLDEFKRKDELTRAVSLPFAVLTILGSTLIYIIGTLSDLTRLLDVIQMILVLFSMVPLGVATYFLIRSYSGYAYEYVPTAQELEDWKKKLIEYNKQYKIAETDNEAEAKALAYLYDRFAFCAHINALNNDTKSATLHKANRWMILAIGLAFITGAFSVVVSFPKVDKVYRVRIVEPLAGEGLRMNSKPSAPPTAQPASEPAKAPPPPPPPPPTRSIKDGDIPVKK